MNGVEVARLRRLSRPGLPILFVTGFADTAVLAAQTNSELILRKPFTTELVAKIGAVLRIAPTRLRRSRSSWTCARRSTYSYSPDRTRGFCGITRAAAIRRQGPMVCAVMYRSMSGLTAISPLAMRVTLALIAIFVATSGPGLADNPYAAAGISNPTHVTQFPCPTEAGRGRRRSLNLWRQWSSYF